MKNIEDWFLPDEIPMPDSKEPEYTIKVEVMVDGVEHTGFYEFDSKKWWVNFGGMTVGHQKIHSWEIDGWKYNDKAQQKQALIDMMRGDEELGLYD